MLQHCRREETAIRRTPFALTCALAALALAGCAPADAGGPAAAPSVDPTLPPTATEVAEGEQKAEDVCAEEDGDDLHETCALEDVHIDGDLVFAVTRVVTLDKVTLSGDVHVSGADKVIVTNSDVSGDVQITGNTAAVVTGSEIGATLTVDGSKHGTIEKNRVDGDLNCTGNGGIDGRSNSVGGTPAGQCAKL